jgi:hypothetical protein
MQPVTSKSVDNLTHLLVKELADMEKKVAFASPAIAFPIMVLPVPWYSKTNKAFSKSVLQFPARRTMSMGLIASSSSGQREERMDTEQAQLYNIQEDLPNSQFSSRPFLSNL